MKKPIDRPTPAIQRQSYLKHEAAIMAMGQLYYLIALSLTLVAVTGLILQSRFNALSWSDALGVSAVFGGLAAAYGVLGYGFRTLSRWARFAGAALGLVCLASLRVNPEVHGIAAAVLTLIQMFALPVGVVITLYAAYLAMSPKGAVVFSNDYRRLILETPQIQYTISRTVLVVGLILIGVQSFKLLAVFSGKTI